MTDIKQAVKERYGKAALQARDQRSGCCGSAAQGSCSDPITSNLYSEAEGGQVPEAALRASLGCGNPTALAELRPGETVLDLGSGGGIDVLLSARRVGPTGKAYGLDMTDEMLALARPVSKTSTSSPRGSMTSKTRGNFLRSRASTSTRLRRVSPASS